MTYLIIGALCLIFFFVLLHREPRSFINAVILLLAALLIFIGFAEATQHFEYINTGVYFFVFGFVPLIMLFIAILLILNGFTMLRKEGKHLSNLLSMLAGFAIIVGLTSMFFLLFAQTPNTMIMSTFWLGSILTVYISATFSALLVYSLLYLKLPKNLQCDYIIVHGCGLLDGTRVSPLLRGRIDKAAAIYHKIGGKAKLVLSGGRGSDEKISEAQAMKDYLLEHGFTSDALVLEDQSTTTYENLQNVKRLLDSDTEKHHYIFVTNNYHVFRTGLFARKLKMDAEGVGCKTALYYWPSAFIREYIAIMVKYKWITIAVLVVWLVLTVISLLPV